MEVFNPTSDSKHAQCQYYITLALVLLSQVFKISKDAGSTASTNDLLQRWNTYLGKAYFPS